MLVAAKVETRREENSESLKRSRNKKGLEDR